MIEPYFDSGQVTLYHGDALAVLRELPPNSARVAVTSPPYWGQRDYKAPEQLGLEETPDEYVEKLADVLDELRRVLTVDGTLWLNLGDTYIVRPYGERHVYGGEFNGRNRAEGYPQRSRPARSKIAGLKVKDLVGIPWLVAFELRRRGWWLRSEIIWHKTNAAPESATDRPTRTHEQLFLLSTSPQYFYNQEAILEPAKWERWGDQRGPGKYAGQNSPAAFVKEQTREELVERTTRNKRTVWALRTSNSSLPHFAMFPETLVEPCILAGSEPGDVVLDPFVGAGTTPATATRLSRRSWGIDVNSSFLDLARDRTAQQGMILE